MPKDTALKPASTYKKRLGIKTTPYEQLLNTQIVGGIILTYAFDYFDELTYFCERLGFTQFLKEIHTQDRRNMQACQSLTRELLLVENEASEICAHAQEKIKDAISEIKQENQQALDKDIRQQENDIKLLLEEKTKKYKAKIAAYEQEYRQQLDALKQEAQRKADERLQTRLKHASTRGVIAVERQKQVEAKTTVEDNRQELALSDEYFNEIHRMIQLLEGYSSYITQDIEKKRWWNNRLRWLSVEELNTLFGTRDMPGRIGMILIGSMLGGFIGLFIGLLVWIFALQFLPHALSLTVYLGSMGAGVIIGTLLGLVFPQLHFDAGDNRFEHHTLSSFSKNLNAKFDEIRQRLMGFQNITDAIEHTGTEVKAQALQTHPLSDLDKKTAKIEDIRTAINRELGFFKSLGTKSPCYQLELKEDDEARLSV
ncbi:MAG: hypothetical protein H0U75_02075 [Legionella sp.]|nr:hypothetical protein [Legionella sp.]